MPGVVADGKCPLCAGPVKIMQQSKKPHVYMHCPPPAEGGCGIQLFCRYDKSDELLLQQYGTRWRDDEWKARFAPDTSPASDPTPEPKPDEKKSFWDQPFFGGDDE